MIEHVVKRGLYAIYGEQYLPFSFLCSVSWSGVFRFVTDLNSSSAQDRYECVVEAFDLLSY